MNMQYELLIPMNQYKLLIPINTPTKWICITRYQNQNMISKHNICVKLDHAYINFLKSFFPFLSLINKGVKKNTIKV